MGDKSKKGTKKFYIYAIILVVICIIYSGYNSFIVLPKKSRAIIQIKSGWTTTQIGNELKKQGIIKNELVFRILSKQYGYDGKYKSGAYLVDSSTGYRGIMNSMANGNGDADCVKITIPEGYTVRQIALKLQKAGLVNAEKFLQAANKNYNYAFLKTNNHSAIKVEGYLFPDTYKIKKGTSEEQIIEMMLNQFNNVFKREYYQRAKAVNIDINKAIIMASLVESEAKIDSERPTIAGVFYNRLNKKMRLQSCATVEYVLPKHKQVLSTADTEIKSPYNTYMNQGLPAGPICNPGLKSIMAALYPKKTNYLFFVAKGDGSHFFSQSYAQHVAAVKKYELR